MQSCLRGLYKHIRTGKLYFAEGTARHANDPNGLYVIYCQRYDGKLPKGTMWIRDVNDFQAKFARQEGDPKLLKLLTSLQTALEKDILFRYNLSNSKS